jgi:hypothetical protein
MFTVSRRSLRHAMLWTLAAAAWLVASMSSGFALVQIAMFAGPGIVLAIAASWAGHAGVPHQWTWRHALSAATIGALSFPPFVALFFAWAGTFGSTALVTLLVFSAWLAVLSGLMVALARLAMMPKAARRRARIPAAVLGLRK